MKERYLSKTPFLIFVYISKCNINLPCYFGNSKKKFLWTGLLCTISLPFGFISHLKSYPSKSLITGEGLPLHRSCRAFLHRARGQPCLVTWLRTNRLLSHWRSFWDISFKFLMVSFSYKRSVWRKQNYQIGGAPSCNGFYRQLCKLPPGDRNKDQSATFLTAWWQKLHGSTGGTRRKVSTRTKI